MLKSLVRTATDDVGRYFYPFAIGATVATLATVYLYLPGRFVVYGLYGLLGLIGGATIYYRRDDLSGAVQPRGNIFQWTTSERGYGRELYAVSAVSIGLVALTDEALFVAIGLGFGYALVVRQLVGSPEPRQILPQLTVLFALSPLAKYLTAGRYIGHSDVVTHSRLVEDVLAGGSLDAIAYASYQWFPGLHLAAATVSSLAGVSAYDGLMLVTFGTSLVVVPAVYLVASKLTANTSLALLTAFGATVLDDLSFYASYAFPQSLATVLFVVLVVLATIAERDAVKWPAVAGFGLVAVAIAYVHHLTQLLFLPVVLCVGGVYVVVTRVSPARVLRTRAAMLLTVAMAVSGFRLWQTGFFERLVEPARLIVQGGPLGGYTQGVTRAFGVGAQPSSVAVATEWLLSPYALYGVLLLTVFSLGLVGLLRTTRLSAGHAAFAWAGVLGAVLIFETPLSIPSLIRIRAPWLFVFAFVVGVGCYQFRDRFRAADGGRVVLALLVVIAAVGPLVTADNYYGLDPRPTTQTSFSDAEYDALLATASFVDTSEEPTAAFWLGRLMLSRAGVGDIGRASVENDRILLPAGHFVYRSAWADHKVQFTAGSDSAIYSNTLYLSEAWLSQRVGTANQVYTAGGTGVLWSATRQPLAVENTTAQSSSS